MTPAVDQILTVAQMRAAEEALIDAGSSVDALMQIAGRGAAEWVWRIAGEHTVTVLCGPGNNGGDGYVIAESLRERGGKVIVVAATEPKTDAARNARSLYSGKIFGSDFAGEGDVLVDCLFGSGLTRALTPEHMALLTRLAASHRCRIAIDLPSGVESDSGRLLNAGLPEYDLSVSLGAWKFAHFLMPSCAQMRALRLVGIGVEPVEGAATVVRRPSLSAPSADSHKYRRGLLGAVGGAMPGAALLACTAAQGAGAGFVRLLADDGHAAPPDLVVVDGPLTKALADQRYAAFLAGPGLGRKPSLCNRLSTIIEVNAPLVLDADALVLLKRDDLNRRSAPVIVTPHEGELAVLETTFGLTGQGTKVERAVALAKAGNMIVLAKGPDSVVAAPDGRIACAPRASSWLSTAGTGDVLAGVVASRLATGVEAFTAACEGLWIHTEAARLAGPAFSAAQLAVAVRKAYAACL
jgi:hydroxyethylthiazole kinase-like uncharacterized protein yjeF